MKIARVIRSAGFAAASTLLACNALLILAPAWNPFTDLRDPDRLLWHTNIAQIRERSLKLRETELLILGDSQVMSGIVPAVLDARLKTPSLNLGMPSQQPEGLHALAHLLPDAASEAGAGPRRVLVNINPFMLFQSPVTQAFRYYYRSELARHAPVTLEGPEDSPAGPGQIAHQHLLRLPLYEANYILAPLLGIGEAGLSSFTFQQLRVRPGLLPAAGYEGYLSGGGPGPIELVAERRADSRWLRDFLERNRGFWTWKEMQTPSPRFDAASCRTAVPRSDLDLSRQGSPGAYVYAARPASVEAYRQTLELLTHKGYQIWLTEIPFSPAYGNLVNKSFVYEMLARARSEILEGLTRPEAVRVISYSHESDAGIAALREARYFHDLTHLSACGAGHYTRWLAGEMARRGL
ncbi:MAG: hypothetical protein NXI24_06835 [bacterium]|nr:hypothetical protein [bacterium]